jgi:outer membrane protein assembly factor BamB
VPSLVVSQGRLVIPANGITVVEPGAGDAKPKSIWRSAQLRPGTASPVVVGGRLLTLNDGGILTCADAQDGKRLWQLRLKGSFSATPVVAGGHLYCVSEEGRVQVVDPSKAEGIVVSELALEQTVIGTPSIAAGSLFVRSDSRLVRLGGTALR